MTRRPAAIGSQGTPSALSGVAGMLVVTIVAACLLWAVYAVSFAYLGAIDQQRHESIPVDTAGTRR